MIRRDPHRKPVAVVFLICVVWPLVGGAQPARLHFETGQAYYQEGAYSKAIVEFTKAYDLSRKAELLYNLGQCHERLGELGKAIGFFERYLAESGRRDAALKKKIKNLQSRLRQTGIRISCQVEGATVTIDGREVGKTPLDDVVSVKPGQHKLTVSKDGFADYSLAVSVVAGAAVTVNAELSPAPTKQPEEKLPGGKKQPAKVQAGPEKQVEPAVEKPRKRLWTWVAYGVAGASLAGGAIIGGLALRNANNAPSSESAEADGARSMALGADILLGIGIAAAITGTVLLFVEGRSESPEQQAAIRPLLGPGYVGAAGSF